MIFRELEQSINTICIPNLIPCNECRFNNPNYYSIRVN